MQTAAYINLLKRRPSDQHSIELQEGTAQATSKRRKVAYTANPQQPAAHINSRKRRRSHQHSTEVEEGTAQTTSKRRKVIYTADPQQPAAYWDNLSEIPLTRRALTEHNRRNSQAAQVSSTNEQSRIYRPPPESATSILKGYSREKYKDLKRFSRCGGPGFQALRAVWIS